MEEDNTDYASLLLNWYRRERAKGNIPEPTEEDNKRAEEFSSLLLDWWRRQKQEETIKNNPIKYIYTLSEMEATSFNLLFSKLFLLKDTDLGTVKTWLSGFRTQNPNPAKLHKTQIKTILYSLHKKGIISILRDKVRLGSVGLYIDYLSDENKKMIREVLN